MNASSPIPVAPVALLIDGDNLSAEHADALLALAREHGDPLVRRVYGNGFNKAWHDAGAFKIVHAGKGKNAADLLLTIDAMDLLHAGTVRAFVIASSDGDFVHLAHRMRECGIPVIGAGLSETPSSRAFSDFKLLARPVASNRMSEFDSKIHALIHSAGGSIDIMRLNAIARRDLGIKISETAFKRWPIYLKSQPGLFSLAPGEPCAIVSIRAA